MYILSFTITSLCFQFIMVGKKSNRRLPPTYPKSPASVAPLVVDAVSLGTPGLPERNIPLSSSHTNLVLMDTSSSEFSESPTSLRSHVRRSELSISIDPSLIALLHHGTGSPLTSVEPVLQGIKAVLDTYTSRNHLRDWDSLLDANTRSLFESLGGWKALVLKLHQCVASLVLSPLNRSERSNAWETTCLLDHIDRMKVNPATVQSSLKSVDSITATVPVMEWFISKRTHSTPNENILSIDLQILWYAVQCCGRFDQYLEKILSRQLGHDTDSMDAISLFESCQFRHRLFSEKYEWYILMLSQQGSPEGVSATLKDIQEDLFYANFNPSDSSARKRIEKLLVQLTGHSRVGSEALQMLNQFYATHDWDITSVQHVSIGEELVIPQSGEGWLELIGPGMTPSMPLHSPLVRFPISKNERISFGEATRCGFFDWRFVQNDIVHSGRIIVQPKLSIQVCKLLVDEVGGSNFDGATSSLQDLAELGFNAVHLEGVLARDNGAVWVNEEGVAMCDRPSADPKSATDRASPCTFLGGREEFTSLMVEARKLSILTIIDMPLHVSPQRSHRKYRDQILEESLLNYRMAETWDTLVADIVSWPTEFGVAGVCLSSAIAPLYEPNLSELLRTDTDGEPHYSCEDILSGKKVIDKKLDEDFKFKSPFMAKLVSEIWKRFPNFVILAQCRSVKEAHWIKLSGLVPVLTLLPGDTLSQGTRGMIEFLNETKSIPSGVGIASAWNLLPVEQLGRARAPFSDLLFTLPFFPIVRWAELDCLGEMHPMHLPAVNGASTPPLPKDLASTDSTEKSPQLDSLHSVTPIVLERRPFQTLLIDEVDVGRGAVELEPANCVAHYARLVAMRRQRAKILESPDIELVPVEDPEVIAYTRSRGDRIILAVINFGAQDSWIKLKLNGLEIFYIESDLFHQDAWKMYWAGSELGLDGNKILVPGFSSVFRLFKRVDDCSSSLLWSSLQRQGSFFRKQFRSVNTDRHKMTKTLHALKRRGVVDVSSLLKVADLSEEEMAHFVANLTASPSLADVLNSTKLRSVLFVTPELGKWSTAGGLGVMVDDLANTMAGAGAPEIWVCSPYYERNRKGETGYLAKDGIVWKFNIEISLGTHTVTVGVHEGMVSNVRHFFVHNARYFPSIYPDFSATEMTGFLTLMGKCALEICCKLGDPFPSTIVTNDWATGLTAAYARNFFGTVFEKTKFMHIVHNLDQNYEGRIFPKFDENVGSIHQLSTELLVDPHWQKMCVNPSRCAILASDNWGTVSLSYRRELLEGSALAPLLRRHAEPFAHPNGIPLATRLVRLDGLGTHWEAKQALQHKFFPNNPACDKTVLFGFVGRITFQKGIHLILDIAESLLKRHAGKVQIMLCGMSNPGEAYSVTCAHRMKELTWRFPNNFWADPDAFFVDGPLVNLGADFGLMPSAFEPGGIVQQEFMVAGTPVIAFKTGGLRDTIAEFIPSEATGNGFTFEAHTGGDLAYAIDRALKLFWGDEENYKVLRVNARKSVVTCDMVAKAWMKEFYRMSSKIYYDPVRVASMLPAIAPESEAESSEEESEEVEEHDESNDEETVLSPKLARIQSLSAMSRTSSSPMLARSGSAGGLVRRSVRITHKPSALGEVPRSVLLAGSFDQWASRIPLKWEKHTRNFFVDIRIPQGKWFVKLIVDGCWICVPEYPVETDVQGNMNNVIIVD